MHRVTLLFGFVAILFCATKVTAWDKKESADKGDKAVQPLQDVTMKSLDGQAVDLGKAYNDKVVLVVNVASRCGLTPQYEQLQALHEKYNEKGLRVVAIPCNQFGRQEPGSAEEIKEFCNAKYGVTFDMLEKVEVNGEGQCELYKRLTSKDAGAKYPGKITWNFEKFLISRDGKVVSRFAPRVKPDDPKVIAALEGELGN